MVVVLAAGYPVAIDAAHDVWVRRRILAGDQVTLELSPYDLNKGRITFRHIERQGAPRPGASAHRR